jgi:hypothetical protein
VRGAAAGTLAALCLLAAAGRAVAEPIFLARQYVRCTGCHFSPTGGGLLTPYGRSLSREELSTFGKSRGSGSPGREHEFLFGALGNALRPPVSVEVELWPAHLDVDAAGFNSTRNFVMNTDITVAFRHESWTAYGELGRQPRAGDTRIASFEHWLSYQTRHLGARAGRFLPAYGIRFSDHTSFTRALLGLDNNDQVYALELSYTDDRHLLQVSIGEHADAGHAFTTSGRWQFDLSPRTVLVASGLFRDASSLGARGGSAGLAIGIAPSSRLTVWTQADARFRSAATSGTHAYTLLSDAAFEIYRGVWLKFSPQLLTEFGDTSAGIVRLVVGVNLLPRTHWNVVLNWYHDRDRKTDGSVRTLLAQLHLYL